MKFLLIGGCILTMGDIFMKAWVDKETLAPFMWGFISYMIGMLLLALSFKQKNIAVASMTFIIVNIVTLSLVSWLYYREPLSSKQLVGMALGLASVFVFEVA